MEGLMLLKIFFFSFFIDDYFYFLKSEQVMTSIGPFLTEYWSVQI